MIHNVKFHTVESEDYLGLIKNPYEGEIVYNINNKSIYVYANNSWSLMGSYSTKINQDEWYLSMTSASLYLKIYNKYDRNYIKIR